MPISIDDSIPPLDNSFAFLLAFRFTLHKASDDTPKSVIQRLVSRGGG